MLSHSSGSELNPTALHFSPDRHYIHKLMDRLCLRSPLFRGKAFASPSVFALALLVETTKRSGAADRRLEITDSDLASYPMWDNESYDNVSPIIRLAHYSAVKVPDQVPISYRGRVTK